jgi:hypothetical protein
MHFFQKLKREKIGSSISPEKHDDEDLQKLTANNDHYLFGSTPPPSPPTNKKNVHAIFYLYKFMLFLTALLYFKFSFTIPAVS